MGCEGAVDEIYEGVLELEGEMKIKEGVRKMKIFGDEGSADCAKVLEKSSWLSLKVNARKRKEKVSCDPSLEIFTWISGKIGITQTLTWLETQVTQSSYVSSLVRSRKRESNLHLEGI